MRRSLFRDLVFYSLSIAGMLGCSSNGVGTSGRVDGSTDPIACQRAKALVNEILAQRDQDARQGLIYQYEAPCNLTPSAQSALGPQRVQEYADACAQFEKADKACAAALPPGVRYVYSDGGTG